MPVRDKFHQAVKTALQGEGWTITADPLYLEFGKVFFALPFTQTVVSQQ